MTRHDIGAFLFGVGIAGVVFTVWAVVSTWLEERARRRGHDPACDDPDMCFCPVPGCGACEVLGFLCDDCDEERWGCTVAPEVEAAWRAKYAAMSDAEKRAGAERLWAAVSETPMFDGLAAETFRQQLDEGWLP